MSKEVDKLIKYVKKKNKCINNVEKFLKENKISGIMYSKDMSAFSFYTDYPAKMIVLEEAREELLQQEKERSLKIEQIMMTESFENNSSDKTIKKNKYIG